MIRKVNPSAVKPEGNIDHGCGFDWSSIPYSKWTETSPGARWHAVYACMGIKDEF
ncbi:MAG TPA: hypothetical protein VN368_01495 [Candidatus Methylomirabilis sp.]|nr:hypothetical protein [Candidatus Methylomirabilis sp.]